MVINKYVKKILITGEYYHTNARIKREIGTGNIKGKKKNKIIEKYSISPRQKTNEDKDEENMIIAW